jgi:hypothetical protein
VQISSVFACRFNVRETGFVDLGNEPYYLYGYVTTDTPPDTITTFEQISSAALMDSNIKFEIIDTSRQRDHPAIKFLDPWPIESFPAAVLVSPEKKSLLVSVTEPDRPFKQSLWSVLESILSSPKREEILQQVIKTYGVVLVIEGPDVQENRRVREAVSAAVERITTQMPLMPKAIANPPVQVAIDSNSLSGEKILLWVLGLDADKVSAPCATVIYGRARRIGPVLTGAEITETTLTKILSIVGADCECGRDRSWILGKRLPVRWDGKIQARVAKALGFDPENPIVKTEISQILRRGLISSEGTQDPDNYPSVSFGYREIAIEVDFAEQNLQNSAVQVPNNTDLPAPPAAKRVLESSPLADMYSPLRNTAFVLIISFAVVIVLGVAVLIRSKKDD